MITKYSSDGIYNYVERKVNTEKHPVYCATTLENIPESFPACYIVETNAIPERRGTALDFTDVQKRYYYEIHTFSNAEAIALTEAREIMSYAEEAMRELSFIESYCGRVNNIDPSVIHIVARFDRIIGGGELMPETYY